MPVEVTQLAKFLNGAFVMAWHFIGLLVNTVTEALHEKAGGPWTFFMYFVALVVFELVAGMKEGKEVRFRDPMNFLLSFPVSFSMAIFPAFER